MNDYFLVTNSIFFPFFSFFFEKKTKLHTFIKMRAVMIRLDAATRFVGVDVEGVQVGADCRNWGEVLYFFFG